jgi:hypothetical protein
VEDAAVGELECQRGVLQLLSGQGAVVDQQRAGEARLDDEVIVGGQVEHDELRAAPAARERGAREARDELLRGDFAQNVGAPHAHGHDRRADDLAIEVAGDRLGLR